MSENFSQRLTQAIRKSNLNQGEIAERAGITAPYLSDLKQGKKSNPSREIIAKLAEILSVSPAWLMALSENISPSENPKTATCLTNPNKLQEPPAPYGNEKYRLLFERLIAEADPRWLVERVETLQDLAYKGDTDARLLVAEILPRLRNRFPENKPPPNP